MKCLLAAIVLATGVFGMAVGPLRADVTAEEVRQAIDRGVQFLKNQQLADGSWAESMQHGGITALCTLALLNAGVDPNDESIQKALSYLRKIRPAQTYVVSLQTMVFVRADPERDRVLIEGNVRWLERNQIERGDYQGAWTYPAIAGVASDGDGSNSQFALLALHEAERVGIVASDRTWQFARKYWENNQNDNGSWGYKLKGSPGTGSMTCAGITSMVISLDRARTADARVVGDRIECCAPARPKRTPTLGASSEASSGWERTTL